MCTVSMYNTIIRYVYFDNSQSIVYYLNSVINDEILLLFINTRNSNKLVYNEYDLNVMK